MSTLVTRLFSAKPLAVFSDVLTSVTVFLTGIPSTGRETLYILISTSIESNTTLTETFTEITNDDTYSSAVRRFARTSLRGLLEHNDFTYYLADAKLIPQKELEILRITQANDSLVGGCQYLIDQFKNELLFNRYVRQNSLSYVLAPPVGVAVSVYAGGFLSGLKRLNPDEVHAFFTVSDFASEWWPELMAAYFIPVIVHQFAVSRVSTYRNTFKRLGLFNIYDLEQEIRLSKLCAALIPTRLATDELLEALARAFVTNHQLRNKIKNARYKISELSLIQVLSLFCGKQTMHLVKAKAQPETLENIGAGFAHSVRIKTIIHRDMVVANNTLLSLICFFMSLIFFGPLVMLVAGI